MISVVVLTKNDGKMVKACLESVKWADEIIVIDQGSTDKTLEIAKVYKAKILKDDSEDFSERRNKGIKEAKGEWVLYVDSDERVLAALKEELLDLVNTDKNAYAISRKNIIFGQSVSYGPYSHDWMIKFFRKEKFKGWVGSIHEYGTFEGSLGYTKNSLLHLTHRDVDQVILKSLEWSKIDAKLRESANHPKMSGWRFIRILLTEGFNQGIKRRGFFGGTVGVVDSMLQTFSLFITYVRLWQMQQPENLDKVYEGIDKKLIDSGFKYEDRTI